MRYRHLFVILTVVLLAVGCSTQQNPVGTSDQTYDSFAQKVSIAGPEAVQSATLYLYCTSPSMQTVNVHRVTADWDETTVTWNLLGGAYDAEIYGSFPATVPGWLSSDVTTLVKGWVGGQYENHGLLLDQEVSTYPRALYFSSDAAFNLPYLEVCYNNGEGDTCEQIPVGRDVFIDEFDPDDTAGGAEVLVTGWGGDGGFENQSLVFFDLPVSDPQPDDSTIVDPQDDSTGTEPDTVIVDGGCTRPAPWWARHSGCGPFKADDKVSEHLPLWLGSEGGEHSIEIREGCSAQRYLFRRRVYGIFSALRPLMSEVLAAKLNIAAGADGSDVADALAEADAFIAENALHSRKLFNRQTWKQSVEWRKTLHAFNVGEIGPGPCDPDLEGHLATDD